MHVKPFRSSDAIYFGTNSYSTVYVHCGFDSLSLYWQLFALFSFSPVTNNAEVCPCAYILHACVRVCWGMELLGCRICLFSAWRDIAKLPFKTSIYSHQLWMRFSFSYPHVIWHYYNFCQNNGFEVTSCFVLQFSQPLMLSVFFFARILMNNIPKSSDSFTGKSEDFFKLRFYNLVMF